MEYSSLANLVGIQIDTNRDETESSNPPSSGMLSARRQYNIRLKMAADEEAKRSMEAKVKLNEEKERMNEEANKLRDSLNKTKSLLSS